jgi:hypothetical protein
VGTRLRKKGCGLLSDVDQAAANRDVSYWGVCNVSEKIKGMKKKRPRRGWKWSGGKWWNVTYLERTVTINKKASLFEAP